VRVSHESPNLHGILFGVGGVGGTTTFAIPARFASVSRLEIFELCATDDDGTLETRATFEALATIALAAAVAEENALATAGCVFIVVCCEGVEEVLGVALETLVLLLLILPEVAPISFANMVHYCINLSNYRYHERMFCFGTLDHSITVDFK